MSTRAVAGHTIEISNAGKPYFPDLTKGEVIDYYERIAEHMLPHVAGRPLVMERFPDGIDDPGFMQKNTPAHAPEWLDTVDIPTQSGATTTYPVVRDAAGLVWCANQGAVVLHTLLAQAARPDRPVEVVFDLDPPHDDASEVPAVARALRAELDALQLPSRVRSSGAHGLHVVVPVAGAGSTFELAKAVARAVAERVTNRAHATLEQRKAARGSRVFVDVLRNSPANHAVATYSLRALPSAPVAVPLDWEEALTGAFDPRRITARNVFRRLGQRADPWSDDLPGADLETAAERLGLT